MLSRTAEPAQRVKGLLHEHGDLGLYVRNAGKSCERNCVTQTPALGMQGEDPRCLLAFLSILNTTNSGFGERLSVSKKLHGEQLWKTPDVDV